jgi:hypothetical protein
MIAMRWSDGKVHQRKYERFEKLARQITSVPKSEIDKRQARYEKDRKAAKKGRAA